MSKSSEGLQELDEPSTREFENYESSLESNSSKLLDAAVIIALVLLGGITAFLFFFGR